eukprot:TRINITY_DN6835_c0_g1_i2.p4 TRINITY_DN6835_c0_g1~~TRINITY_DN6835_c0_g1_i2.p4  ORF type:complete len:207 (-),score=31.44 TRINITY_DN6835_c0_g1_i2:1090-1710(-)
MAATATGNSGSNNLAKAQEVASDVAQQTIQFVRSASIKLKEKLDDSGMTEYSQKLAAKVVNEGVPTVTQKLRELLDLCWQKFVEFLDSKGLKEPLEHFLIRCRDFPVTQAIWKILQTMFTYIWKAVLTLKKKPETVADSSVEPRMPLVEGNLSVDDVSSVTTPPPTIGDHHEVGWSLSEGSSTPLSDINPPLMASTEDEQKLQGSN